MIETLDTWWSGLTLIIKVFYTIGMFSTAVLGFQTVLAVSGLDGMDGDTDLEMSDSPGDGDLGFISIRTIFAFLVGFGWVGAILLKSEFSLWLVFLLAPVVGIALMVLIYLMMKALYSMRESGTLNYRNAVGEIATVYLPIPGGKEDSGQVEVMIQGRLMTVPAITSKPDRLENRSRVLVVDVLDDNTLVVVSED